MRILATLVLSSLVLAGCLGGPSSQPADAPVVPQDGGTGAVTLRSVDFSWDLSAPKPGQSVFFTADAPGAEDLLWDFGDGETSDGPEAPHVFDDAGIYEVVLTAQYAEGPDASASHIVTVGDVPASPSDNDPVIAWELDELNIVFSFAFAGDVDAVGWDFGDGGTSNDEAPIHAYARPGTYDVQLRILSGETFYQATASVLVDPDLPTFVISDVGRNGPEPSIGVTSDGCIFFMASANVLRSCDRGAAWTDTGDLFSDPSGLTFDPYMWVDPVVDRIWAVNMLETACSWIAWSDDGGDSWTANPWDCGLVPGNDHIKIASGPWPAGSPLATAATYDRAVYFCVNKITPAASAGYGVGTGIECSVSLDGGATFPISNWASLLGGGLHGAIEVGPDGTVYVPPRVSTPTVLVSHDAGQSWSTKTMGSGPGTPDPRKNSEVATDTGSNAYHVWIGSDFGVYMSRSTDSGDTWAQKSIRVSPDHIPSATFAHIDAGDPGRIAIAYLGSENHAGNPHDAPADARYDLYVTFSLNALDDEPTFTTVKATLDPVQVGSICINSADCKDGNRNLLDFNDVHIGPDGRVYVAFADGCTGACANSADPAPGSSRSSRGTVAILETGPSLYADVGTLSWPG